MDRSLIRAIQVTTSRHEYLTGGQVRNQVTGGLLYVNQVVNVSS